MIYNDVVKQRATENLLTSVEIDMLYDLERVIERGRQTFIEVGEALFTIRDNRLYREQYRTFEAYVQERWKMGKAHANRMIDASKLAADLAPIGVAIENENQARELGKLSPDVRQEAIERVREDQPDTGQPLPAKAVIAAAKSVGEKALTTFMQPEATETTEKADPDAARHAGLLRLLADTHAERAQWEKWRESGISNADLRRMVGEAFGTHRGVSHPGLPTVASKGGSNPRFWFDNLGFGQPTWAGRELIAHAREALQLPFPNEVKAEESEEEEDDDEQTAPTWETPTRTTEAEPIVTAEPAVAEVVLPIPPASVEIPTHPTDELGMASLRKSLSGTLIPQGKIAPPVLLDGKLWTTLTLLRDLNGRRDVAHVVEVSEIQHVHLAEETPQIYKKQVASGARDEGDYIGLVVVSSPGYSAYVLTGAERKYQYMRGHGSPVSPPEPLSAPIQAAYVEAADKVVRLALYEVENALMEVLHEHAWSMLHVPRETPVDDTAQAAFIARWRPILQSLCTSAKPMPAPPAIPADPQCERCGKRRASVKGLCVLCLQEDREALMERVAQL